MNLDEVAVQRLVVEAAGLADRQHPFDEALAGVGGSWCLLQVDGPRQGLERGAASVTLAELSSSSDEERTQRMADFVDEKRREIEARMKELRPMMAEYQRLEAAATALAGVSPSSTSVPQATRPQVRAAKSTRKTNGTSTGGRRGRPKGSGKRADEALALVTAQPGITIPQIAKRIGIKQNYLYRVMPNLAKEGQVKKDGPGWYPAESA